MIDNIIAYCWGFFMLFCIFMGFTSKTGLFQIIFMFIGILSLMMMNIYRIIIKIKA